MDTLSSMEKGEVVRPDSSADSESDRQLPPSPKSWYDSARSLFSRSSSLPGDKNSLSGWSLWCLGRKDQQQVNEPSTVRSLASSPRGYPSLATFLDSDENFMLYRRFGYLQTRLLLDKQDDLRKLELKLDRLDNEVVKTRPGNLTTRDLRPSDAAQRKELMDEIELRFCEYANLMSAAQQLVAANRPAEFEYKSVANYIRLNNPLQDAEQAWIHCKEDIITLRPGREHSWLDYGVEYVLKSLNCDVIQYLFCSAETKQKGDGVGVYYTRSRINVLVVTIITMMILALLIVPVYILYHLVNSTESRKTDGVCLGTLLVFTLAFSAVLSLFTKARRHEVLGAAAGYCAVLVVFLGNVGNNNSSSSIQRQ